MPGAYPVMSADFKAYAHLIFLQKLCRQNEISIKFVREHVLPHTDILKCLLSLKHFLGLLRGKKWKECTLTMKTDDITTIQGERGKQGVMREDIFQYLRTHVNEQFSVFNTLSVFPSR